MRDKKSTRIAFGEALHELGREQKNIVVVTADTGKSMGVDFFTKDFPERSFNAGIAEQNMVMMAAGLASTGKMAFAVSYSAFTSTRSLEQLKTFVCYPKLNVKIVGGLSGFSAGIEGVTHMALEDVGIIRCIPNIIIFNPADYYSTKKAVYEMAKTNMPCYLRVGRDPTECIFDEDYSMEIGKARILKDNGDDLAIFTTGIITTEVLKAANELEERSIGIKLIEFPTLKPIDKNMVVYISKKAKKILVIEEHNCIGGLYSAVCETVCQENPVRIFNISVPCGFTQSGSPKELVEYYGLSSGKIHDYIINLMNDSL